MFPIRDNVPSRSFPVMTCLIIAANVAVFLHELSLGPHVQSYIYTWGLVPRQVVTLHGAGLVLPFFTSMFLHGGWAHLIGNMWFLWLFGDNVEDRMGPARFLAFYLVCGLAAGLAHLIFNITSPVPSVGASGAIGGVLGAYFLLYPKARVDTVVWLFLFIQVVQIPAFFFLGLWFVMQLFSGMATLPLAGAVAGGVAYWAHIGGFAAGFALVKRFITRPPHVLYYTSRHGDDYPLY